ncbi:MAG: S41 family peptidase [Bacteroidales bacterium]|nr:S41 family peptidase [Bacteroidales bacterium]
MKKTILISALLLATFFLQAQDKSSRAFDFGKWTRIHSAVLQELNRSYVDSLPIGRLVQSGIDAMLSQLDPYTVFVPEDRNEDFEMMISNTYGGIGAVIYKPDKQGNVIINEPYENAPAHRYGLRCGDEIMAIDGVSVHGLDTKACSDRMKGKPGTSVVFHVKDVRTGGEKDITVVRERIHLPDIEYSGMVDDTTGYALLTGFTEGVSKELAARIKALKAQGMKQFVLDLRGNGGGLMHEAVDIVGLFVPKGTVVVTARGSSAEAVQTYATSSEPLDTALPLIVLVDSASASSSEIVAGSLQDLDRATIMGARTFGKGLVQSVRPLPFGAQLKVTIAKYYTPSGRCVQAIDYSRRNEDGSVGHIPDSLTHAFKTAHGRTVRDGGGITPDVTLKGHEYSRLTYSLVVHGVTEQYVLDYVRRHESIAPLADFHFTDADYEDFITFAKNKEFDYRSGALAQFDQMRATLAKDGLEEQMSAQLDALHKALEMDKETFLRLKKTEIVPILEEEIAVRYYFQPAGVQVRLRYDTALREALRSPKISY